MARQSTGFDKLRVVVLAGKAQSKSFPLLCIMFEETDANMVVVSKYPRVSCFWKNSEDQVIPCFSILYEDTDTKLAL